MPDLVEGQVYQALREVDAGPWQNVQVRLGKPEGMHYALGEYPWTVEEGSPWPPWADRQGYITRYGIERGGWTLVSST